MGACLSKGHEAGATAPSQHKPVATNASATVPKVKAQNLADTQHENNLHVEDANKQGVEPLKEEQPLVNHNGPQQKSSQASSAEGTPVRANSLENSLPPLKTSPFATSSSTPVQTPVQSLEPTPQRESSSDQEEVQNGWGPNLQADLCSGDSYAAVYPFDSGAERKRVHALKRLGINYTSNEPSLDFITKLVTNVCGVASAVVTFIDSDHCYIKSSTGIPTDTKRLSRRISRCSWVLAPLNPEVLVVEDLSTDDRFKSHPFVIGRPFLRFLAAAPLLDASGQRVGALTVHDFKPKKFDAEQCNVLCNFAEMTVREIQRITESSMQRSMSMNLENEQLLRSIDDCSDGVVLLDVRIPRWPVLFSNEGWSQLTGQEPVSGSLKCFWDIFRAPGVSASRTPWQVYDGTIERGETFQLDVILAGSSGKQLFPITFKPATETLDEGMVNINVPAQAATAIPTSRENKLFYFGTILRKPREDALTPSLGARNSSFASAAEDDVKPPIAGVRLGPLLGKGSFGSVHYGTWNGAQIAVKVIQHMATEAERQARDEQLEAILGLKMLHPNIVRTFQFATKDRTQSRPASLSERMRLELNGNLDEESSPKARGQRRMMETWIVLELCNRGSLQDAIDKGAFKTRGTIHEGTPNMVNILRTATEIAGAMTYLHSLDILHSDLNGNNILLISNTGIDDRPFSVKVSDFGLSRIHIGERTIATQTYGTVTHMPPELLSEGRLSKAADVYAFGVLLWEMLTGQRPWAGLRHVQIITHKMRNGTQLKWPSDVHPDFKRLAQHCMTPDPHHRPTFAEVLDFLEPLRDLAERGELPTTATYTAPERTEIGALLGSVKEIEEEGEEVKGSK